MKIKLFILLLFFYTSIIAQNVIIVVVDGGRYPETFGSGPRYIPHIFNDLAPKGTIFTNFRIADEGLTSTNPGQASILTGTWQVIANDATERPNKPTVFEYYRKEIATKPTDCFIVAGKKKMEALSYSTFPGYGSNYGASTNCFDADNDLVYDSLTKVMDNYHPRIILVNFPTTDKQGHDSIWNDYLSALTNADWLVYQLWQKIQNDSFYKNNTTMFLTNDHGRHTNDFKGHGDDCDGCEHIMLLAIGKNIPEGITISELHYQIDIVGTIGKLLGFSTPYVKGIDLFQSTAFR